MVVASLARLHTDPVLRAFLMAPLDDEPSDDDEAELPPMGVLSGG